MAGNPEEFLIEDYKQKISYLTAHVQRMWTRFNFFVTLETALLGGKLLVAEGESIPMVGVAGMILSAVWYVMGTQDRFLTDFYRWQVKEAAGRIQSSFGSSSGESATNEPVLGAAISAAQAYVGSVDDELIEHYRSSTQSEKASGFVRFLDQISSWRARSFSTTRLAAWIPLLACALWGIYTVVQI